MLLTLSNYANDEGMAWPSIPTLARKARLSDRQVRRALRRLESLGEIQVKQYAGQYGTHLYRLTISPGRSSCQPDIYDTKGRTPCPPIRKKNPSKKKIPPPDNMSGADKLSGVPVSVPSMTEEMIIEGWNMIPGVQYCRHIGPTVSKQLDCRIKDHPLREWWRSFFSQIQASDFLCGRQEIAGRTWRPNLSWAMKPTNRDKILAGNYDNPKPRREEHLLCNWKESSNGRRLQRCGQAVSPGQTVCAKHVPEQQKVAALRQ